MSVLASVSKPSRIDDCQATAHRKPTILAVDFYATGDLLAFVAELNAP